jgi:hypothetical protein
MPGYWASCPPRPAVLERPGENAPPCSHQAGSVRNEGSEAAESGWGKRLSTACSRRVALPHGCSTRKIVATPTS